MPDTEYVSKLKSISEELSRLSQPGTNAPSTNARAAAIASQVNELVKLLIAQAETQE